MKQAAALVVAIVTLALANAAPSPSESEGEDPAQTTAPAVGTAGHIEEVMVTQSPAEAIQDAIKYDPAVASALRSNETQLYLLKSVTYKNGTAEDLDLPKKQLLPDGPPDRIKIKDKIIYSPPGDASTYSEDTRNITGPSDDSTTGLGIQATLQLIEVPIN